MSGVESFNHDDLIMSSTAYYLGRQTINVESHCQSIMRAWPRLSQNVREYIQRIVEDFFKRQEIVQSWQHDWNPFGGECDRESWQKVRECWISHVPIAMSYQDSIAKYQHENQQQ